MILENVTMFFCDNEDKQHYLYIPDDQLEDVDMDEFVCPICGEFIASEASRTIAVANNGKDTLELLEVWKGSKNEKI